MSLHLRIALALAFTGCRQPPVTQPLTVAAAANLTEVFTEIGKAFTAASGVPVTFSYASTAQLAQQIESGAPFDVFAAADVEHVEELVRKGKLVPDSLAIYARGLLALWVPQGKALGVGGVRDLVNPKVRFIAIAKPEAAPYGAAAVETLRRLELWPQLESKIVYGTNVSMAKQQAATGNADAAFTAYSLVLHEPGVILRIEPALHHPLDQALAILAASKNTEQARKFTAFVASQSGIEILEKYGYTR